MLERFLFFMNKFPFNQLIIEKGRELIQSGSVHQINFSEGTYQVEVTSEDKKEIFWPFLQIDDSGNLKDSFCTCQENEKNGVCRHLSAAFLEIYKNNSLPLHRRFKNSLWNHLCEIASKRHGYDPSCLIAEKEERLAAFSQSSKKIFWLKPETKKGALYLKEILFERVEETEETSLKFSNLSSEELRLWREGNPTHHLQYELSFWSDLAKKMMLLQEENQEYQIIFHPMQGALPKEIEIRFSDFTVCFYIAEVNWKELIFCFEGVKSSLSIYEYQDLVFDEIEYDRENKQFHLTTHQLSEDIKVFFNLHDAKAVDLGEWVFHPNIGFYAKKVDPVLREKTIKSELVAKVLHKHAKLFEKYLTKTLINTNFLPVFYDLFFDEDQSLHIVAFLFEKGDLQKSSSALFGGWVFLEDKGFFQLGHLLFNEIEKVVPKRSLSEFITKNKLWLNQYEGFRTHLNHIECYLTYHIDSWSRLVFKTSSGAFEDSVGIIDLQDWVYILERGFYPKASTKIQQVVAPGVVIPKEDISSFIRSNEEDLETIHGFFNLKQPVEKLGLEVYLNEDEQIVVKPKVSLKKGYRLDQVRFFGDYSFVKKEGFSLLPKGGRIPQQFEEETILGQDEVDDFIYDQLPVLKPIILSLDSKLKHPKQFCLKLKQAHLNQEDHHKKWMFDLVYQSEYGEVEVKHVWQALKQKQSYLISPAGLLLLDDSRFSWLRHVGKAHFNGDSHLELSTLEWMRLTLLEKIEVEEQSAKNYPQMVHFLEEMKSFNSSEIFSLDGLQSHLRGYQETGVKWLWFLYVYGLSGLLCDEMGLGKTHQAMALLAAVSNAETKEKKKFLVVCPTSVIYHWEDLLKRFLPKVKVFVFYGVQRSLEGFCENGDVLLTSYGTLRSEKEPLSEIFFEVVVFDELHIAKNAHSLTHKALRSIKARMKLGLTGTPIENRLIELHSLFDVVLPSYLPDESTYKDQFVLPIEKNQDKEKKKLLTRLIHPFTLRRKKEEVLSELPEKIEEISYVELSDEQKTLYKELCEKGKEEIFKEIEGDKKGFPYLHIFSLFNSLKQLCNHPALIHKDAQNYHQYKSGKWDLFVELLEEARESGRKVVVFSQYLKMLDIIEAYLISENIVFAQIRGSTKNRKEQMVKFKEDPKCEVFIGSLQAAGVGIDLISASVVIHYDRWWNPAKENQATDRVHRMGQSRGVQVFKLVSKDTIEEHIHKLIEKKLSLLKEIIVYDDQDQVKHIDKEDLLDLIKKLDYNF